MAKEPYSMPSKPFQVPDTSKKTTTSGPYGGGTDYQLLKPGSGFQLVDQRFGHSQKANVERLFGKKS